MKRFITEGRHDGYDPSYGLESRSKFSPVIIAARVSYSSGWMTSRLSQSRSLASATHTPSTYRASDVHVGGARVCKRAHNRMKSFTLSYR